MNANAIISAEVSGKVITLVGAISGTSIMFLGASCPASVKPGQTADSISLSPGDKEEVVAIRTVRTDHRGKYPTSDYDHFILPIIQKDQSGPWIQLGKAFVPKQDHVGQIVPDLGLTVRIGDEFFLSPILLNPYYGVIEHDKACQGYRKLSVDDANLLCRFMAGQVETDEVKAAAAELVMQTVDVPIMKARIAELEKDNSNYEVLVKRLGGDFHAACTQSSARQLSDLQTINALKAKLEKVVADSLAIINGTLAIAGWGWNTKGRKLRLLKETLAEVQAEIKKPA